MLSEIFDATVKNNWMTEKAGLAVINYISKICILTSENVVYRLGPDAKDNYLVDLAIQNNCPFIISDDTKLISFLLSPVKVKSTKWFLKSFPI